MNLVFIIFEMVAGTHIIRKWKKRLFSDKNYTSLHMRGGGEEGKKGKKIVAPAFLFGTGFDLP